MTIQLSPVATRLLDEQLASGKYASPMAVVEEALQVLANQQEEETLECIRRGAADVDAGRTCSVEQAFDDVRREFGWRKS